MIELTADNALAYLHAHGTTLTEPARAEVLSGGVSAQVLRIRTADDVFVLKQARPQLRTREAWFSDVERIFRECAVMATLEPLLPPGVVPKVRFVDRANFLYAMDHAPGGATVWKAELLAGHVEPERGRQAGSILGRIHQASADHEERFQEFIERQVYVQLRVEPFYRRVQERRPEVAMAIETCIYLMLTLTQALCHGDFTPKNMLLHERGITLVDYETAHLGDPTMDLGLFLAHLTLKALRQPDQLDAYLQTMRAFWQAYVAEVRFRHPDELEWRGVQHLGVCLLARVDGTSPVDYLPEPAQHETVRRLARHLLLDGVERWDDAWTWCAREFTR